MTNIAAERKTVALATTLAKAYDKGETAEFAIARDVATLNDPRGLAVSYARIASLVGIQRAKMAHPEADDATIGALCDGYAPSRPRMAQLALGYRLVVESLCVPSPELVAAGVKLASRAGSEPFRKALVSDSESVKIDQRPAWFLAQVSAALVTIATTKRAVSAEDVAAIVDGGDDQTADEGIGQDGSPVAPLTLSADTLASYLYEAASREWSASDVDVIRSAIDAFEESLAAKHATV